MERKRKFITFHNFSENIVNQPGRCFLIAFFVLAEVAKRNNRKSFLIKIQQSDEN